jgi:very-short-patch-repair endonuclease
VTFSQAQQTLIENLIDEARTKAPELDEYFAEERDEPVFVKNLENVQGDERDVILFSICYGPDSLGRVSMNFGPMNREGGERRLNVAITRARRQVIVFSTLKADQVDLSRTRARGVTDLKAFLEYAEHGPAAIAKATRHDVAEFDSPFEEAVYDALVKRGWEVHKQVGCARYRIDLAVVDPAAPGRYILGIECDGANYHRAKTARDRDKLREGVLRDLGWRLHRIWSTDWWTDPDKEIRKLEAALERGREARKENPASGGGERAAPTASRAQTIFAAGPASPVHSLSDDSGRGTLERYQPAKLRSVAGAQADFYDPSADGRIREFLIEVVRDEGPISVSLAARRVAASWGFGRVSSKVVQRIRRLIPKGEVFFQNRATGAFLWSRELESASYVRFRVPDPSGNEVRQVGDIALEEIGNAIVYILEVNRSAPCDELVHETASLFGFERAGRIVSERIKMAIQVLAERGIVEVDGERITLSR